MKWLVTYKKRVGRQKVADQLKSLGCDVPPIDRAVSLGNDEEVLSVEGPNDLVRLAESHIDTMRIYPNSKMNPSKY